MSARKTGKTVFWLAWLLCLVAIVGLVVAATGRKEIVEIGEAAFRPVDNFARMQFGDTYSRAVDAIAGLMSSIGSVGEGLSGAFAGIAKSLGLATSR